LVAQRNRFASVGEYLRQRAIICFGYDPRTAVTDGRSERRASRYRRCTAATDPARLSSHFRATPGPQA
jgi:uncharacterized protein (UPF0218 family)